MKKALAIVILLSILLSPSMVQAQAPTPPSVPTLGPVVIISAGDGSTYVNILSLQNQSYSKNPVALDFSVKAMGMLGQFGNVGYSVDDGTIYSVSDFLNKSVDKGVGPDWYWDSTTVTASAVLPQLSDGVHSVTVYYGWQYLGTPKNPSLERFEVTAYANVVFNVGNSPAPAETNSAPSVVPSLTTVTPESSITPSQNPASTPSQSGTQTGFQLSLNWENSIVFLVVFVACLAAGVAVLWRRVNTK
jgi:hypothetical protein